jgi:hypothetical protein
MEGGTQMQLVDAHDSTAHMSLCGYSTNSCFWPCVSMPMVAWSQNRVILCSGNNFNFHGLARLRLFGPLPSFFYFINIKDASSWSAFCLTHLGLHLVFNYVKMLSSTSGINHSLHTICSYFEGQLTPISENDVDDKVDTPQIRVTEAAEKVCSF